MYGVGGVDGALGIGIEEPDGVDFIVPEFDAVRQVSVGREEVQDAAAEAERAGRLHLWLPAIAELDPGRQGIVDGWDTSAFNQMAAAGVVGMAAQGEVRRKGKAQGGGHGRHHQRRRRVAGTLSSVGEGRQSGEALVSGTGIYGEALEGQDFGFREQENGGRIAQVGQQLVVEATCVVEARGNDDDRTSARGGPKSGQVHRLVVCVDSKRCLGVGLGKVAQVALQPGLRAEEGKESGEGHV